MPSDVSAAAALQVASNTELKPRSSSAASDTFMESPRDFACVLPPVFSRLCLCEGVPGLITADMVKEGAAVIDVGINRIQDPKTGKIRLVGDVDFDGE